MSVIVDTNVVLDLLLERQPFVRSAVEIFRMVEESAIEGLLCATTITTIDYLLKQSLPAPRARDALRKLIGLFEIAAVNRSVIEHALESGFKDFEDAVLEAAGRMAGADSIITRNARDFTRARLKVFDPEEFLAQSGPIP